MSEVDSIIPVDYHFPTRSTIAMETQESQHLGSSFLVGSSDAHQLSVTPSSAPLTLQNDKHCEQTASLLIASHSSLGTTANGNAPDTSDLAPSPTTEPGLGPPVTLVPSLLKRKSKMEDGDASCHISRTQDSHCAKQAYKHMTPLPSLQRAFYDRQGSSNAVRDELSSPVPVARSLLLSTTPAALTTEPGSPLFKTSMLSPAPSDSRAHRASSDSTSSDAESGPASPMREAPKYIGKIPLEDVVALREFLRQVDLRHYGFQRREERSVSLALPTQHPGANDMSSLFNPKASSSSIYPSLRDDSYYNTTEDEADVGIMKLAPRSSYSPSSARMPLSPTSSHASVSSPLVAKLKTIRKTSSPLPSSQNPSSHGNGHTMATHVPYRGKHGPNPVCASCRTTKTPYWRDAWHQGILLCNACGLRFAKFKRRCTSCHYVPRKDDKGNRCCPLCKGSWTQ